MSTAPQPVAVGERIETMDVIRGFALFGILLMNIVVMGQPMAAYFNPAYAGPPSAADFNAWFVTNTFFEGSMRTLFSMLFGAGFILLLDRLEARGLMGAKIFMRRMALLMLMGIIDIAVFLWAGDILFAYGTAGLFLLLFWRSKLRGLIVWAAILFLATSAFNFGGSAQFLQMEAANNAAVAARDAGQTLTAEQEEAITSWQESSAFWSATPQQLREANQRAEQGWSAVSANNLGHLGGKSLGMFAALMILDPLAAMVLGMIAYRIGLFQGRWSLRAVFALSAVAFAIGIPINLRETYAVINSGYSIHGFFSEMATYDVGRVSLALGWLGVFLMICKAPWLKWLRIAVGSVGRMALSNYLSHSIIAAVLFVGLGAFGDYGRAQLYVIVACMWAFNIVFSMIWLSMFNMGPFEWLWRAGTYGYWPPLVKERSAGAAPAPA